MDFFKRLTTSFPSTPCALKLLVQDTKTLYKKENNDNEQNQDYLTISFQLRMVSLLLHYNLMDCNPWIKVKYDSFQQKTITTKWLITEIRV